MCHGIIMEGMAASHRETRMNTMNARKVKLFVIYDGNTVEYSLTDNKQLRMGRRSTGNMPDLPVDSPIVSREHGLFCFSEWNLTFQDSGSTNGTSVNEKKLGKGEVAQLYDGSVLRIHAVNNKSTEHDVVIYVSMFKLPRVQWKKIPLSDEMMSLEVGRNQQIALQGKTVSRKHATFFHARNGWAIIDNQSRNGVFLNGSRIKEPVLLQPMDLISIAHHIFLFDGKNLLYQADIERPEENRRPADTDMEDCKPGREPAGMRPEVSAADMLRPGGDKAGAEKLPPPPESVPPKQDLYPGRDRQSQEPAPRPDDNAPKKSRPPRRAPGSAGGRMLSIHIEERNAWNRLRKKTLLRDIDLQIESGSLVLILGGSGAGKTTFMNAVMGYEPAKGRISYGQSDIYREYEKMKYEIGYVPQQDLLRMEDVVYETLDNAAQMRLPDNVSDAERAQRVENALQMFGLSRERDAIVAKLSGGQRKRLSIAVEYIGNPSLFFLDEPDSGLDGIMAKELMTNLRQIADQKKIVMVISHSPDRAFELFDKVIVLAKGNRDGIGHLVYYGAPTDACRFFGTDTLEGIVGRVNRKDEGGEGLADYFIEQFKRTGIH